MDMRVGLVCLLVLVASWACHARQLVGVDVEVYEEIEVEENGAGLEEIYRNDKVCTLCEQVAAEALGYISENKTQSEIIDMLHNSCSRVPSLTQQCVALVDYYAPLFFSEASSVQPGDFCQKVNLCPKVRRFSSPVHENGCGICHKTVSEVIIKLKDPDTQLEVLEMLLKACNSMEKYVKKCKKVVFEFAPIIFTNAEHYLETNDVCTMLHVCNPTPSSNKEMLPEVRGPLLAES
jgi:saposin